jgi:hypothetical protein
MKQEQLSSESMIAMRDEFAKIAGWGWFGRAGAKGRSAVKSIRDLFGSGARRASQKASDIVSRIRRTPVRTGPVPLRRGVAAKRVTDPETIRRIAAVMMKKQRAVNATAPKLAPRPDILTRGSQSVLGGGTRTFGQGRRVDAVAKTLSEKSGGGLAKLRKASTEDILNLRKFR